MEAPERDSLRRNKQWVVSKRRRHASLLWALLISPMWTGACSSKVTMAFFVGNRVAQRGSISCYRHHQQRSGCWLAAKSLDDAKRGPTSCCRHQQRLLSLRLAASSANDDTSSREAKYQELRNASRLSLAPMMEYTDRHFRHLVRLISSRTLLYTEMVSSNAIAHEKLAAKQAYRERNPHANDADVRKNYDDQFLRRYLGQGSVAPLEGQSVLQLGGSDPQQLYDACQTVMDMTERGWCDYTAINLNCGCPSPKVAGKGCFGAALMDDPKLVAELTKAMHDGCDGRLPVTVKCRIGTDSKQAFTKAAYSEIDPHEEYADLCSFLETVAANGVVTDFQIHARIAVLSKSFSPADNRKIPPLKYNLVHRLVQDYPELTFSLNGGIDNLLQAQNELNACPGLAGVMIGRGWAADPWGFALADRLLYDETSSTPKNRLEILKAYGKHADNEESTWDPVKIRRFIVKAVTPLFAGEANAKKYRIALDELAGIPKKLSAQGMSLEGTPPLSELIINAAIEHLSEETLLRTPEETYDRILWEEKKRQCGNERSQTLIEWETRRKLEEASTGSYIAPAESMTSRATTNV